MATRGFEDHQEHEHEGEPLPATDVAGAGVPGQEPKLSRAEQGRRVRIQRIDDEYDRYSEDYGDAWAVGRESVIYWARELIKKAPSPKKLIDFGSGFTSLLTRVLFPKALCMSVETSDKWLVETINYLTSRDVSTSNVMTWERFRRMPFERFDFMVWDIGQPVDRVQGLDLVKGQVAIGGMLWVDDMQRDAYRREVISMMERDGGWIMENLAPYTTDRHGRYGYRFDRVAKRAGEMTHAEQKAAGITGVINPYHVK